MRKSELYISNATIASIATFSYFAITEPDDTREFIFDAMNTAKTISDYAIRQTDINGDGCTTDPVLQNEFCISVGGYLKSRISKQPLPLEETKRLPSFTGEPYPASPFQFSI